MNKKQLAGMSITSYFLASMFVKISLQWKGFCNAFGEVSRYYQKKYNKKYNKSSPERLKKHRARAEAYRNIKIPKGQKCEEKCGRLARERHHEDYDKPLEVRFVCKKCHDKIRSSSKEETKNGGQRKA